MKHNLNEIFDQTAESIRAAEPTVAQVNTAADHVWTRVAQENASPLMAAAVALPEVIRNCDDYQALIPAYLNKQLAQARTLLLEDHSRECLTCRRALKLARTGEPAVSVAPAKPSRAWFPSFQLPAMRWAMAAAAMLVVGFAAWPFAQRFLNSAGTLSALVEASNGSVFRVTANATEPLTAGTKLNQGERLRTAKDAGAILKLSDGSVIETRERTEFSLNNSLDGTTVQLDRGQVIVQAAKQNGGRKLFVATPDAMVAVKGTIFAVNSGTKGARVSVVEGEVELNHGSKKALLHPGEQAVTHESIAPVRVREEVAWSRDASRYQQLLDAVKRDIDARVAMPGNRYSTRLLDLMPENTVLYAAIPNLTTTLEQANQILQENIQHNPELRAWWEAEQEDGDNEIGEFIKRISAFGKHLGSEIAIGADREFIALAEVRDAEGLRAQITQELAAHNADAKREWQVQIFNDTDALAAAVRQDKQAKRNDEQPDQLLIWLDGDVAAVSSDPAYLQKVAASFKGANQFTSTAFHARLADVYREGAGFVIGADLERFIGRGLAEAAAENRGVKHVEDEATILKGLGVTRLKHFIAEMKESNGKAQNRAQVTFEPGQQHGFATWLAAPGPMGALQFISPDANVIGAFVVQSPTALFDDLMNALKTAAPKEWQEFVDLQAQHGINLREDFAAALGGEFAAALDGPVLPTPAWKVVAEVNDAAKLQASLERAVTEMNKIAAQHNHAGLLWERADSGGKTFYRLKATSNSGELAEVNYAYAYGFMIAAPSRALVENAIKYRESGYTILQSSKFKAALPEDKQANFSALLYQNLDSVLTPLTKGASRLGVGKDGQGNSGEAPEMLLKLFGRKAGLAYAYALGDRMIFSLNTEDGGGLLTPSSLLGLDGKGLFSMKQNKR
jgi:hypothetical protein